MMTRLIEQKQGDLLNSQTQIQTLNQLISNQKSTILQLQISSREAVRLDAQLFNMDLEKLSVIRFDYVLAKKVGLIEDEMITWEQASKAQYDIDTTAYLLSARNMISSLRPMPYGIGKTVSALSAGVRFIAGTAVAGAADTTPSSVMDKLRHYAQQTIQINQIQLKILQDDVANNEQTLLRYNTQANQLEHDLQLLIVDENRKIREKDKAIMRITLREQSEAHAIQTTSIEYLPGVLSGAIGAAFGWSLGAYIIGPLLAPCTMGLSIVLAPIFCILLGGIIGFASGLTSSITTHRPPSSSHAALRREKMTYSRLFSENELKPRVEPASENTSDFSQTVQEEQKVAPESSYEIAKTSVIKPFP